jgi:hypothetical protein
MQAVSGGARVLSSVRFRQIHRVSGDSKKYHLTLYLTVVYASGCEAVSQQTGTPRQKCQNEKDAR